MDAHGVYVLYGADHDDVICEVAHDLELELLPACDALFDEGAPYGASVEAVDDGAAKFAVVGGGGASFAAQGEAGPDDKWEADLCCQFLGFGEAADRAAGGYIQADSAHGLGEELAVLGFTDRRDGRSEEFDACLLEDACLVEFDGEVEGGLASQGGEQRVGTLPAQYLGYGFGGEGLDVGYVCDLRVRHYGRRVGVYEDHAVTLLAQGVASLGARVIELCGLPDHDRTRADDQDAGDVVAPRHARPWPSLRYCSQTLRTGNQSPWDPGSIRDGTARSRPSYPGLRCLRRCRRRGCGGSARRRPRVNPRLRRSRGSGSLSRCVPSLGSLRDGSRRGGRRASCTSRSLGRGRGAGVPGRSRRSEPLLAAAARCRPPRRGQRGRQDRSRERGHQARRRGSLLNWWSPASRAQRRRGYGARGR